MKKFGEYVNGVINEEEQTETTPETNPEPTVTEEFSTSEFVLTVNLDNAAFEDGRGAEISRLLKKLATKLEWNDLKKVDGGKIMDSNGNSVGAWEVK